MDKVRGVLPPFLGGVKSGFVFLWSRTCKKYQTKPDVNSVFHSVISCRRQGHQTMGFHLITLVLGFIGRRGGGKKKKRGGG